MSNTTYRSWFLQNFNVAKSAGPLVPISIEETNKGLYILTKAMPDLQQLALKASLELHNNIPCQFHKSSRHGDVLVVPYSHRQQLFELKASIDRKLVSVISTAVPVTKPQEILPLPKIEILVTTNKGLYVPITSLSEIHRSELQGLLQKNSVKFHHYKSPSQGEVLVVPYSDWSQLQQTQSEIAIKIDTLRADKENVPKDENPLNKEYHLKAASKNARVQLDNLQYSEPK